MHLGMQIFDERSSDVELEHGNETEGRKLCKESGRL